MRKIRRGFSIVELVVACAAASLLTLGIASFMQNLDVPKKRLILFNVLTEKRHSFESLLLNRSAFLNTINSATNSGFDCIRTKTPCAADKVANAWRPNLDRIVLYDGAPAPGNVWYDGRNGNTKGFTAAGVACNGFVENGPGNDACPIGYAISWHMDAPSSDHGVVVTFNVKVIFNPSDKHPLKRIINSDPNFSLGHFDLTISTPAVESTHAVPVLQCQLNGINLANGGSYPFYFVNRAPAGSKCIDQTRVCNIVNGIPSLSGNYTEPTCAQDCAGTWSACTATCGGGTTTFHHTVEKNPWGVDCADPEGFTKACNTQACPVNCVGSFGACNAGSQSYTITTPASGGGMACPYNNGYTQSCAMACDPRAGTLGSKTILETVDNGEIRFRDVWCCGGRLPYPTVCNTQCRGTNPGDCIQQNLDFFYQITAGVDLYHVQCHTSFVCQYDCNGECHFTYGGVTY